LKSEIQKLQPGKLDAKACFRHLAGISTPNVTNAAPIRPIFVMDMNDERIVPNKDVAGGLEAESNLATMPWDDFEHLVRQLFEWMFTNDGVEVKVTRASRDRGVDAIMFDPDPVRGGKYVLQAKRYTRTVDVAAVRDLYGTIVNEGANRGILVTTATFGPDAYEFAKNKPISLIDGPNLIAHLRKHGRHYKIDLEEARRIEAEYRSSN
jgi:restriction system protein